MADEEKKDLAETPAKPAVKKAAPKKKAAAKKKAAPKKKAVAKKKAAPKKAAPKAAAAPAAKAEPASSTGKQQAVAEKLKGMGVMPDKQAAPAPAESASGGLNLKIEFIFVALLIIFLVVFLAVFGDKQAVDEASEATVETAEEAKIAAPMEDIGQLGLGAPAAKVPEEDKIAAPMEDIGRIGLAAPAAKAPAVPAPAAADMPVSSTMVLPPVPETQQDVTVPPYGGMGMVPPAMTPGQDAAGMGDTTMPPGSGFMPSPHRGMGMQPDLPAGMMDQPAYMPPAPADESGQSDQLEQGQLTPYERAMQRRRSMMRRYPQGPYGGYPGNYPEAYPGYGGVPPQQGWYW